MPELPEVETTRRGIEPYVASARVEGVVVRERRLRWPVPARLKANLTGRRIEALDRRAKYLLFRLDGDRTMMLHLGMSGSLRIAPAAALPGNHDHVDILLDTGRVLRFNDPRRFGSIHWIRGDVRRHPLLAGLGPEPLDPGFDGAYLAGTCAGRRIAIKPHIMNGRVVVGVGNIYASEALFRAGIRPSRAAGRISAVRLAGLAEAIREVLADAIRQGGTTLRDFAWGENQPGYFSQALAVYGRAGEPCLRCGEPVKSRVLGQRATYFCPRCQR
ncbi:MAG: bifunctional DNA-formamidopyrimidine glycosylase/DNA-(apurinic or apyrimidinic site) lyase [Gammaproteobacteria bacterium]